MKWERARWRLLGGRVQEGEVLAAEGPGGFVPLRADPAPIAAPAQRTPRRAASICVASGKGGTGKSVLTASLARLLARRGRTLLIDADFGVGNAHILQGVHPARSLVEVVEGEVSLERALHDCGGGLDLLAAGSGVSRMTELSIYEMHRVARELEAVEGRYEHLLVDSAAGVSSQTVSFAAACDVVLLATTPDITAMTDAYAFFKVLLRRRPGADPLLVVNRARGYDEAYSVASRMDQVSRRYLGRAPRWIGYVPDDPLVVRSVNERNPLVVLDPDGEASRAIGGVAVALLEALGRAPAAGLSRGLLSRVGYSPDGVSAPGKT
jgi:flagellar biosynthesis protein FlhG